MVEITEKEKDSLVGFFIYVIIFIFFIPYLLLNYKQYEILAAYFPNLDNLATAIGYMGGPPVQMPGELWKYLRESCKENLFEFLSVSFIHYVSLLGLTFTVASFTNKYNSISKGWSIAFFMLFITYIIPGHLILKSQDEFGKLLNPYFNYNTIIHYIIIASIGISMVLGLIIIEEKLIHNFSSKLAKLIRYIAHEFNIKMN